MKRLSLSLGAVAALLLGACAELQEVRDPQVSDLVLDRGAMSELNRVNVPMPPPNFDPPPQRAEAASLWRTDTASFFTDRRATEVGDLVTVLININDRANLANATERSRSATQTVLDPDILDFDTDTDSGVAVGLESTSEREGQGSIRRNENIRLRVAATVMQILPNNNFVIAGRQEVKVNQELRELRIAGIIRPEDIYLNNTIDYDKIAEARISYGGRGQLSVVQQARIGHDVLEIVLPY